MSDLSPCCAAPLYRRRENERRCSGCGHRQRDEHGNPPVATRSKPFWLWPDELIGRHQARHAGRRLR